MYVHCTYVEIGPDPCVYLILQGFKMRWALKSRLNSNWILTSLGSFYGVMGSVRQSKDAAPLNDIKISRNQQPDCLDNHLSSQRQEQFGSDKGIETTEINCEARKLHVEIPDPFRDPIWPTTNVFPEGRIIWFESDFPHSHIDRAFQLHAVVIQEWLERRHIVFLQFVGHFHVAVFIYRGSGIDDLKFPPECVFILPCSRTIDRRPVL